MENLRDFANRFTHTHEGENIIRAYRVIFPQQFEEAVRNTLMIHGYTLENPVIVVVLNIAQTELTQTQIENECRRTLARKAGATAKNGREATVAHVVGIMPDKSTFWVHREGCNENGKAQLGICMGGSL